MTLLLGLQMSNSEVKAEQTLTFLLCSFFWHQLALVIALVKMEIQTKAQIDRKN